MQTQIQQQTKKPSDKKLKLGELQNKYSSLQHPFADFSKTKIVFGEGNIESPLLFLGEGPGREEDISGRPFVGRAGKLLTSMINAMGLAREEVYITNVIKCRLPDNRRPTMQEIATEKKLILDQELAILQPKIICTLGASAMHALLGENCQISQTRGNFFTVNNWQVLPTYHPAYLLRNPSAKSIVWNDLQLIMHFLKIQTVKN